MHWIASLLSLVEALTPTILSVDPSPELPLDRRFDPYRAAQQPTQPQPQQPLEQAPERSWTLCWRRMHVLTTAPPSISPQESSWTLCWRSRWRSRRTCPHCRRPHRRQGGRRPASGSTRAPARGGSSDAGGCLERGRGAAVVACQLHAARGIRRPQMRRAACSWHLTVAVQHPRRRELFRELRTQTQRDA
jgi:hypothetical protein